MEDTKSYVTGMLLSFISWEAWESMLISIIIALIGGFAAAAGRQLHQNLYKRRQEKIKQREKENEKESATDEEPMA